MTKLEAINELFELDHCFLHVRGALAISKPFGFKPRFQIQTDNRSQFKGLTLNGINPITGKEFKEGDTAQGIDAADFATQLANHLGVVFQEMYGRGSQLRSACEAIRQSLQKN